MLEILEIFVTLEMLEMNPSYFVQMACDDIRCPSNYQYYGRLAVVMFVGNLLKMNWTKSVIMRIVYC